LDRVRKFPWRESVPAPYTPERELPASDVSTANWRDRHSERVLLAGLAAVVVLRLGFHALFVPVWEGPDEPFHASRVVASARGPLRGALDNRPLAPDIVGSIWSHPCCAALRRYYPCAAFGGARSAFNILAPASKAASIPGGKNPENNQPPLFYLAAGLALAPIRSVLAGSPEYALLACRLIAVALVVLAVFGPLRRLTRARAPAFSFAGLLLLALPGASESLMRCANDGAIFLWSAALLACLEAAAPTALLCALTAAGPLLKPTAFPVVAVAAVWLWIAGRQRAALGALASAAIVLPIQFFRGWSFGGGFELNRSPAQIPEGWMDAAAGFARSVYTMLKTTFWIGEWSFFQAPRGLVVAWFLLIAALVVTSRWRSEPRFAAAHLAGALVLAAGTAVFLIAHRRYWGQWGGVPGWYVWGWMPWLAVAWNDCFRPSKRAAPALLFATGAFVAVCNVLYFREALAHYG